MSETTITEKETPAAEGVDETSVDTSKATEDAATESDNPPGAEALGDPGKKALDAMKSERNEERKARRELESRLAELQAKIDGKEAEYKAEQERRALENEALSKANERILKAEVRAAAASKLADPADALRFIDLSEFEVGSDGDVDADAINGAIDDLIKNKPYLAAQGGKRFQGTADSGARNEGTKPSQLSKSDLERMTPDEINQARAEGRLDDLLGVRK